MSPQPRAEDLERLVRWVDEDNEARHLSLYVDRTERRYAKTLDRRRREIEGVLAPDRVQPFQTALQAARDALEDVKSGAGSLRGAAVFTAPEHDRTRAFGLPEPITTRLVWDTSPYIRPLARFVDDYEGLAIVLLEGERVAIHHVEAAQPRRVYTKKANLGGRHRKGGWSQMRYQRTRSQAVEAFLDDVVGRLERLVEEQPVDQVLVAGQGSATKRLVNRLPARLAERLSTVETIDLGEVSEDSLLRELVERGRLREAETSRQAASAVLDRVARGELATAHPFEVARCARDGRVDVLVVDEGASLGAAKCETHQTLFERGQACSCGSPGTDVDLSNEAVEYATRSEARIEFVEGQDRLRRLGGIAATLRW